METVPMTSGGYDALDTELKRLKGPERQRIIKAISEARAHGDLSENAEYHAAKEQQGLTEARIREIEGKLSASQIIDIKKIECTGRVIFGSTVSLLDMQNDEKISYQIVGEDEANVKNGKISYSSPLARSLIGKEEGEATKFESPSGIKEYEILEVSHI